MTSPERSYHRYCYLAKATVTCLNMLMLVEIYNDQISEIVT